VTAPRVSVVVPTYQRADLLGEALASARAQTFADFELVVVDDGSTDGTRAAVAGLARADARIRYAWQPNAGVSAARNHGVRLARGEIVALLDADDVWRHDHLAVVTQVLDSRPEAVLCSTSHRFDIAGRAPASAAELADALPALFAENVVGHPSGVAVRRRALAAAGGWNERLHVMEGWELWLRLAATGPFAFLRRRTFRYRATPGSLSERGGRGGEYAAAMAIVARSFAHVAAAAADRRDDAGELVERAAGTCDYFDALRALASDYPESARPALAAACARLPELSREPQLVANRLALVRYGAAGRLAAYSAAALAWPDPAADTPLYLRLHALALAVRLGRGRSLVRLLRRWPLAATPGFFARNGPLFAALARRTVQKATFRARDASSPTSDGADR
jgi:hypothetical protein